MPQNAQNRFPMAWRRVAFKLEGGFRFGGPFGLEGQFRNAARNPECREYRSQALREVSIAIKSHRREDDRRHYRNYP